MKPIHWWVVALGVLLLSATPGFTQQCGDLDGSGEIGATDALLVLSKAVGQPAPDLVCPLTVGVLSTGHHSCYEPYVGWIDCAGSGQDGEFQKGVPRSFTDNGDGTVTDNATGLMWEKLSDDDSIHDYDNAYTWADAIAVKVATLNAASFAKYTDWRLPNSFELFTLADHGAFHPATDNVFSVPCEPGCGVLTCSCTQPAAYWSSTQVPGYAVISAYSVGFVFGLIHGDHYFGESLYVRAVRGGS